MVEETNMMIQDCQVLAHPSDNSTSDGPSESDAGKKNSSYFDCGTGEAIRGFLLRPLALTHEKNKNNLNDAAHDHLVSDSSKIRSGEEDDDEYENHDLDEPVAFSDLSDPKRNLWIVTTAALPWRTGTAINPFLRALYFVRRRIDLYESSSIITKHCEQDQDSTNKNDNMTKSVQEENHDKMEEDKVGKVTLVIPWLVDMRDAQKLYGKDIITKSGDEGKQQQLQWIRKYAAEQCNMEREMKHLHIVFYDATYWPAFGSIFATVDICSLIPAKEADVAILEEPEHLNWLRVPGSQEKDATSPRNKTLPKSVWIHDADSLCLGNNKEIIQEEDQSCKNVDSCEVHAPLNGSLIEESESMEENNETDTVINELGWAHKFNFVVGIIHTNYTAYMKQYGLGSTIVAAPVINAMSSMVIRAYCHKVIRLSGVIPSYARWKEVTCNVHGVRGDFLGERNKSEALSDDKPTTIDENTNEESHQDCAPIYFIGKLLWAKGFDKMLKVQESYRSLNARKEYFPIDIFGGGPDEVEIKRAFHGRLPPPKDVVDDEQINDEESDEIHDGFEGTGSFDFSRDILTSSTSIRGELMRLVKNNDEDIPEAYANAKNYINAGFEVVVSDEDRGLASCDPVVMEYRKLVEDDDNIHNKPSPKSNPISILNDVSEKSISTGISTTKAVKSLADSALKTGLAITFTQDDCDKQEEGEIQTQPSYRFDPPKTIYELRRTPIPARFLGVKDHATLRDMPYKIFLNPSVTEVLCTTTAEALAMGKFVIIPKHVSNEFFFQFSNCLYYESLEECVHKITWALENEPSPLSEEESHIFTWDAATDRMIEASIITKGEARDRSKSGFDKADSRMAKIHSEGGKKSSLIHKTFFRQPNNSEDRAKMEKVSA